MLRRTRWRLIAWSGGSTMVVLLVLGIAIYAAAATSLTAASEAQLEARYAEVRTNTTLVPPRVEADRNPNSMVSVTSDPSRPGVVIGGELSGTIAIFSGGTPGAAAGSTSGTFAASIGQLGDAVTLPDPALLAEASVDGPIIRETTMGTTPVRVLVGRVATASVTGPSAMILMVIGDRRTEIETLRTLLFVLLGGGLLVLAASVAVGYVYAGRALVPIRESLRHQREFAADASHELRTPLAITRAAIAELRRGRGDPETVDRALTDLDAGAIRLESLVDDLLLLARTDADAVDIVDGEADLAHAAAMATEGLEAVGASRDVRLALDLEPAPLRGDEARLRQLVTILVDNAIRHSPAGGRVTVTVRQGARLVVEDEGPGIAPEHIAVVFDRFWRAPDAPAGGTGLGLAIARWIADRHGGSIQAENRIPGPGARFSVRFPVSGGSHS